MLWAVVREDNAQRTGIDDIGSDRCGFSFLILQYFFFSFFLLFFCHERCKLEVSLPQAISHM